MRVGVIGLGKLGLPYAEALAAAHDVYGYDLEPRRSERLTVVPELPGAIAGMDLVLVALPTPHDPQYDGSLPTAHLPRRDFEYAHVRACLAEIDELAESETPIGLVSTVLPGTIRRELAPATRRCSLVYTPAFMAMGQVESDFLHPEFRLVGTVDGQSGKAAALLDVFRAFGDEAPVHCVTWEEAEAVKIFYNVFISFKLAFVNTIQDVVERTGHANADTVTSVLAGADRRLLSSMYLRAGMGDGGPCHPRDLIALRHLAERYELGYDLFGAIAEARDGQARNLGRRLASYGLPVLLTHRSYKPGVTYEDGSYALLVGHYASQAGAEVRFLDGLGTMPTEPHTVLLVHDVDHDALEFPAGSVVVDPWRRYQNDRVRVVHYGDTRAGA